MRVRGWVHAQVSESACAVSVPAFLHHPALEYFSGVGVHALRATLLILKLWCSVSATEPLAVEPLAVEPCEDVTTHIGIQFLIIHLKYAFYNALLHWYRRGIRHGSTAASGLRARVPEAAAPGAPEFEYEQGMQANLNEGFQGGDDAGTETAHALFTRCACTHPCTRAHTCTHPCTRTHTHARKPVCTDAHTNTHVRALRYMHAHLHTCSTHTYTHA